MVARVISIVNQKGGVGKTTTAVNLSTAFAIVGCKVLVIDSDPQGNATTGFGIDKKKLTNTYYDVLIGNCSVMDAISRPKLKELENIDVLTATVTLSAAEIELDMTRAKYRSLIEALEPVKDQYDIIMIDCPPSLGMLTVNALVASDSIVVPLQCEFYALEGLSHLFRTYQAVKANLNRKLAIDGVILTMYDKRNKITSQIEDDVRSFVGVHVYQTRIPRNVRLSEAPSHGKPAIIYDVDCPGSVAYIELAKEVLQQIFPEGFGVVENANISVSSR
jgi:chromosome partitioning protein